MTKPSGLSYNSELVLPARKTVLLQITAKEANVPVSSLKLPCQVSNLLVAPGTPLEIVLAPESN
jgi:hypothetical protein